MIELFFNGGSAGEFNMSRVLYRDILGAVDRATMFDPMLYYGNIDKEYDDEERIERCKSLFYFSDININKCNYQFDLGNNFFITFKKRLNNCEDIRLWYEQDANAMCVFFFMCNYLKDYKGKVYMSYVPILPWGKLTSKKFGRNAYGITDFTPYIELINNPIELTNKELTQYANQWIKIKNENKPLRILNGNKIVSVDKDYYDERILELAKKTVRIVNIYGEFMDETTYEYISAAVIKLIKEDKLEIMDIGYNVASIKVKTKEKTPQ